MKQFSIIFKHLKLRLEVFIIHFDSINNIAHVSIKIPELLLNDISMWEYCDFNQWVLALDKCIFELELELRIIGGSNVEESGCCNWSDELHKSIVEDLRNRLVYELSMEIFEDNDCSDASDDEG